MYHYIFVGKKAICETGLNIDGIACGHVTEDRAKAEILRVIEQNPDHPVGTYSTKFGTCSRACRLPGGIRLDIDEQTILVEDGGHGPGAVRLLPSRGDQGPRR